MAYIVQNSHLATFLNGRDGYCERSAVRPFDFGLGVRGRASLAIQQLNESIIAFTLRQGLANFNFIIGKQAFGCRV